MASMFNLSTMGASGAGGANADLPGTSKSSPGIAGVTALQRSVDDALAFPVISFSGLELGSEVRILRNFGSVAVTELGGFESYTGTESITVPFFGSGLSTYQFQIVRLQSELVSFALDVPRNDVTVPIVQSIDRVYDNP